ncbi:MAG: Serine-protein kinase RsbW [Chlamydiia bacterium]|nr:Serine-protein kinase RsbW [Chlamydiia bacterium]MCH9618428.1 Serine-protein kinase RsbW [Chlamydiia bacterium]MCH9623754.1 Serine-protein kinase RsbW [Chlamydiia bacterium]
METKVFPAVLSSLDPIMLCIRDVIRSSGICPKQGKNFEVALEEAVVNIIHYAYDAPTGMIEILCKLDENKKMIIVKLKDMGIPFNPLEKEEVTPPTDIASQEIGGLGIHFIKKLVDTIEYTYIDGANILTLTKMIR